MCECMHACVCVVSSGGTKTIFHHSRYIQKKKSCKSERSHPLWRSDLAPFPQNIIHFIFLPSINLSAQFFFAPIWRISGGFSFKNGTSCIQGTFQTNTHQRKSRTSGGLVDFQAAVLVQSRGGSQIDDLQTCTLQPTATAEQR